MKCALLLAVLLSSAGAASTDEQSVAAVQKVIQMLGDMSAKCKQEKADEQIAFAEFGTWCKMEQANLKESIKKGAESIEVLTASIGKLGSEAKVLGEEISTLQSNVAEFEADMKAATKQRAKDHEAFLAEEQDYAESVDALERALVVMQKQEHDRPASSAALLQVSQNSQIPEKAKAVIAAFMGMMDDDSEAPEANAYEFQSGGIVSLLKKLKDEFREKLGECQKEEMNSKHAYDMKYEDLKDSVENSNAESDEKTATKARKEEQQALDKKELASTISVKKEDESTLKDTETECEEKTLSFDEKQKLRTEEIEAIQTAIGILKGDDMQTGTGHLALSQSKGAGASLAQLRGKDAAAEETENIHRRLTDFLAAEGTRLHSREITLLAEKVAADPFAKVKKLIDAMITRLLEEAHADADHEGFCDTEIGKSKVTRAKLSEDIDALNAAIEEGKSTIMSLTEEVATLSKEVADLDAAMVEATKMRTSEKAKNKVTVEDSSAAVKAVSAATAVLKKFYEGASQATAMVQTEAEQDRPIMGSDEWDALANPNFKGTVDKGHKAGMQTFGKTYAGQQDEAGGVLAMLEVISADFNNVIADTKAAEAQSQTAYEDFMAESKKNKAMKEKKIDMDNADKAAAETKLQDDTKDYKGTQDELLAADRYYEKLVPQCFDKGMTFEERTKAREAEIASLKQALKILSGQ